MFPFGAARRKRGREDLSIRGNRGRRKRRGLTPRREGADRGARGLIEVSTFKVAKTRAVSRAHGRHYLFIYATFNYGRETAKLIAVPRRLPRDRDSRRYLHANSRQAQILPFRTRKNLHRGESGPRVRTERVRRYAYDRAVCHLRPAFRPPVSRLPSSLPRRSLRPPCHSLLPATPTILGRHNRAFLNY